MESYYERNKERIKQAARARYLKDKQTNPDKFRKYYAKHKDRILSQQKKYDRTEIRERRKEKLLAFITEYKLKHPCIRCGESDPVVLQFHHRDPKEKLANISQLKKYSFSLLSKEIAKCDVLCANCHLRLHEEKRNASL
jgi:hypothetical protein